MLEGDVMAMHCPQGFAFGLAFAMQNLETKKKKNFFFVTLFQLCFCLRLCKEGDV